MRSDALITGRVRLRRSGGGFGASRTDTTVASVSRMPERSGNSEAMCPSGPTPRKVMSNRGGRGPPGPDAEEGEVDRGVGATIGGKRPEFGGVAPRRLIDVGDLIGC